MTAVLNNKCLYKNADLWARSNPKAAVLLPYADSQALQFCKTHKGELNLKNLHWKKNSCLHSQSGAQSEAQTWFKGLDLKNKDVLYVYGVGLGYYYDSAKEWLKSSPNHFLVFLEDDLAVIFRLFETEKGTHILQDPQVSLHYLPHLHMSKEEFEQIYWNFIMTEMEVSALNAYAKHKPAEFSHIHHKIVYDASVKNALLDEYLKFGAVFFRSFYANMLCLEGAYLGNQLFGKFEKVPAVICGAGPSLEKQLPILSQLSEKALIFAGGSALNALNSANILPHFGAGIDPNAPQFDRLSRNQSFEVPFFYRNRMFHQAYQMIHGPRLYITGSGGYDVSSWFEEKLGIQGELLDEGHNVVNFCVEVAYALGCDPILFVGMDLAYTGLKAYAPGVVDDRRVKKEAIVQAKHFDDAALLKKDVYGKPIYTLWKWIAEADWIGQFAKDHPEATLINCTEGGIGFPDIPNHTFQDAVHKYLIHTDDLRGRVNGEIQSSPLPQVTRSKVEELMRELQESLRRCIENLDILIEESEIVKQKIKKEKVIPSMVQSGRAALCEVDLADEPGYQYVLQIFNAAYSRVLNRDLHQANLLASEVRKQMRKLELNQKRFAFLRDVTVVNIELIRLALEKENFDV